ncbi:hypothetical protein ANN_15561 [Periplaneta americana]|uniref:Uncharacterized protein n=1 Tax=Periplaneta americana TaxID=6978 RepID=A0ABQ8SGT6_PERAM|nr:hypothetical protein ANN_15561 [Periplaneta americana]
MKASLRFTSDKIEKLSKFTQQSSKTAACVTFVCLLLKQGWRHFVGEHAMVNMWTPLQKVHCVLWLAEEKKSVTRVQRHVTAAGGLSRLRLLPAALKSRSEAGGSEDEPIAWPTRSPDLTLLDFLLRLCERYCVAKRKSDKEIKRRQGQAWRKFWSLKFIPEDKPESGGIREMCTSRATLWLSNMVFEREAETDGKSLPEKNGTKNNASDSKIPNPQCGTQKQNGHERRNTGSGSGVQEDREPDGRICSHRERRSSERGVQEADPRGKNCRRKRQSVKSEMCSKVPAVTRVNM